MYEHSTLRRVLGTTLEMQHKFIWRGMLGTARPGLGGEVFNAMRVCGSTIVLGNAAFRIEFCLRIDGACEAVCVELACIGQVTPNSSRWRISNNLVRIGFDRLPVGARTWYYADNTMVLVM